MQAGDITHIRKSVCVFLWPCNDGMSFWQGSVGREEWKRHFLKNSPIFFGTQQERVKLDGFAVNFCMEGYVGFK